LPACPPENGQAGSPSHEPRSPACSASLDAAEAGVRLAGLGLALAARAGAVALAVAVGAQERPAALHALGLPPPVRVDAAGGTRRVVAAAPRARLVAGAIPVGAPLPDVARHVGQPIAVGRVAAHGGGAREAIQLRVLAGELPLPGVGHPPP